MKKLFSILICLQSIGFAQTLTNVKTINNKSDTTIINLIEIDVEFISIIYDKPGRFTGNFKHLLDHGIKKKNSRKPEYFKIRKSTIVLDENKTITLFSKNDLINFFTKYGYTYEGTDSDSKTFTSSNFYTGEKRIHNKTTTIITFKNNNN